MNFPSTMTSSNDVVNYPFVYQSQNLYYLPQSDDTNSAGSPPQDPQLSVPNYTTMNPAQSYQNLVTYIPMIADQSVKYNSLQMQNQVQSNIFNPMLLQGSESSQSYQQQQPLAYLNSHSTNGALSSPPMTQTYTQPQQSNSMMSISSSLPAQSSVLLQQTTGATKPMPSEDDPFFIPIQGIVPPSKNADGRYECNICNRTYTHAKHLKRHTMRHTGQKPYECAYCSAKFTRPDIRTRHALKCRLQKMKESSGSLPDNLPRTKDGSVKKNPAASAATKVIFKCAPQIPSAITAMNRAKNAAASSILTTTIKTKPTPLTSTSPKAATTPQSNIKLEAIPEVKTAYSDYPTPVSNGSSPTSTYNSVLSNVSESVNLNETFIPGYVTPIEPQLSVFNQQVSQNQLIDPELCSSLQTVPLDMYSNGSGINSSYCLYNSNQPMMMNQEIIPNTISSIGSPSDASNSVISGATIASPTYSTYSMPAQQSYNFTAQYYICPPKVA